LRVDRGQQRRVPHRHAGASVAGTGNVQFTVAGNTGAARAATLTITGTAIAITQSAP
jgi:hypothetical protein